MKITAAVRPGRAVTRALLLCAALALALLALPGSASAAPPANNNWQQALQLGTYDVESSDTSEATSQSGEPLTVLGAGSCTTPPPENRMGRTVWYKVTGTAAAQFQVNTFGSGFDTQIAVYRTDGTGAAGASSGPPSAANLIGCRDNQAGFLQSRVIVTGVQTNKTYLVQVGGRAGPTQPSGASGELRVVTGDVPVGHDLRANALALTPGASQQTDNIASTEADGELLECTAAAPFASTVWFRYSATAPGKLTVTASGTGVDTVMVIYRDNTQVQCNDDSNPDQFGPSRVSIDVTPGDYFVQIGGWGGVQGDVTINSEFAEDLDGDNDGSNRPADCNDGNPNIRPGANDVPENGVDENCVGGDAENFDRDGDGFNRPQDCNDGDRGINPGAPDVAGNNVDEDCSGADAVNNDRDGDKSQVPADCNDNNPAIRPGARDIPGNRVDEDCSGGDARYPVLTLKYSYNFSNSGRVTGLTAKVKRGASLRVSCKGRGCPKTRTYKSRGKTLNLRSQFRRALRGKATIQIRALLRGHIGKVAQIKYNPAKRPTDRVLCIPVGSSRAQKSCS